MLLRWLKNPKALVFAPLILVMIAAVACGGAATTAPEQAAAPTASSGAGPTASSWVGSRSHGYASRHHGARTVGHIEKR